MIKLKFFLAFALMLLTADLWSNTSNPDSLIKVINAAQTDTTLYLAKLELANTYLKLNPDSSLNICTDIIQNLSPIIFKSDKKSRQRLVQIQTRTYALMFIVYRRKGKNIEATQLFKQSKSIVSECNNVIEKAHYYSNYANILLELGSIQDAIEMYGNAREIFQKLNDKDGLAGAHYNIARMLFQQNKFEKSIEAIKPALELVKQTQNVQYSAYIFNLLASNYIKIANNYIQNNKKDSLYDLAAKYMQLSLDIKIEFNDIPGQITTLNNLSDLYLYKKDLANSLKYVERALELAIKTNNSSLITLSYIHYAQVYLELKQYDKTGYYANLAFEYASKIHHADFKKSAAEILSRYYKAKNQHENALKYYEIFVQLNDSLISQDHLNQLVSTEQTFRFKTKNIEDSIRFAQQTQVYKIEMLKKEAEINQKKTTRNWLLTFIVFLLVLSFTIYRNFINQRKSKQSLSLKNQQIEEQYAILEEQKTELQDMNLSLKKAYQDKIDSIKFAKKIQATTFPSEESIKTALPNSFIIYKPLDIVSGDFYWVRQIGNEVIIAVGDSTGHGVPGAFMSIMGIAILKELINNRTELNAAEILGDVRLRIIESLRQYSNLNVEEHYGMDLGLVIYNRKTKSIQYSGAFTPLYIIRNPNNLSDNTDMLTYVKPDKMPISLYPKMEPYTNHQYTLSKGDSFYMFTDGTTDQFGGQRSKKLGSKVFIDQLLETSLLPLDQQKNQLESFLTNWKISVSSDTERGQEHHLQTDDITILGVRV